MYLHLCICIKYEPHLAKSNVELDVICVKNSVKINNWSKPYLMSHSASLTCQTSSYINNSIKNKYCEQLKFDLVSSTCCDFPAYLYEVFPLKTVKLLTQRRKDSPKCTLRFGSGTAGCLWISSCLCLCSVKTLPYIKIKSSFTGSDLSWSDWGPVKVHQDTSGVPGQLYAILWFLCAPCCSSLTCSMLSSTGEPCRRGVCLRA